MHKREELKYIIAFFSSFLFFGFFALPALAQDAIQCTLGDVKLNRNLKFVSNNNIYLGTGKLNFSSTDTGLYAANDGGNLLLKSPAAISLQATTDFNIQSNGNILFKDISGNTFAQLFTGVTPPLAGAGNLLVNGKIEGLGDVQGNKICVTGVGTQCVSSWSQICDPGGAGKCNAVETNNSIKSGTDLSANGNIYTGAGNIYTNNGDIYTTNGKINADNSDISGKRLCIGVSCINSWAQVTSIATGGGNITNTLNQMTFGGGTTFLIDNGATFKNAGTFQVCDAGGVNCVGTGRGVSKIIDGDGPGGISLNPPANDASADGDVTIGLNLAAASFDCQQIEYKALIERWFVAGDINYDADCDFAVASPNLPGIGDDVTFPVTCPDEKIHHMGIAGDEETSLNLTYETHCPINYVVTGIIPPDTSSTTIINLPATVPEYKPKESGSLICCKLN